MRQDIDVREVEIGREARLKMNASSVGTRGHNGKQGYNHYSPFSTVELERNIIEAAGFELAVTEKKCITEEDVIGTCKDADVLLVQWVPITRKVLEALPRVKCVVRYGVGVDNIDLNSARDLGVTIANVPEYCTEDV